MNALETTAMQYAQLFNFSTEWLVDNAISVLTALLVLWGGWFLSGFLSRQVRGLLPRTQRIDNTIAPLISELVRYGVIVITVVIVLGQFGVQTASILAVLGAAGLAIALALQGTLSNIAAGVMIIWLRPFNVGEYIDADGIAGTIVEISLFSTRMRTYDGIFLFVPNSKLWDAKVTNYTREPKRMVETKVGIAYDADLAKAREAMLSITKDERVLADPEPFVFVAGLGASAVDLTMRSWVAGSDYWKTNVDFNERAKLALDAAGVEIPYNKLDVMVKQMPEAADDSADTQKA
ncbi:mechanosensitive ion channel family protein [Devosia sp.]|uniref:mechanosensitive ion channel family protein n=1 Tax=Devosia sp. TaxID=1871048 RepID=UPI003A939251